MRFRDCFNIIFLIVLISCSCRNEDEEQRMTWSSDAPLSIPYRVRLQRLERGNLIRNHSFENGKIFKLDSATTSFAIDGWQQIGNNVEWTDIRNDSLYNQKDALSGYRAVKITRPKAYETDTRGEGILSDFVKVIPGNYNLNLFVRLENIKPLRARLGTRMFDAVDISIQYYDRNKILMKPGYRYPMSDQIINTSFKGLSFANFRTVPYFKWAKITGKSNHFPFPEGDIPSDAHFIRVFIGLKGTGTLWVDSINFSYTDRNFSVNERMAAFTDTSFRTPEVLIPNPKILTRLESVVYYDKDMPLDEYPVIVVHPGDEPSMKAAKLIQEAFGTGMKRFDNETKGPRILSHESYSEKPRLIINVGKTPAYNKYQKLLPVEEIKGHRDGYFIFSPPENPKVILIGANNGAGLIYAAHTVIQMIDDRAPVFHCNNVIDYPDFANRYLTVKDTDADKNFLIDFLKELRAYKLNGAISLGHETSEELPSYGFENFNVIPVKGYYPPDDSNLTYLYPLERNAALITGNGNLTIPPVFHNEMLDNSDYSEICCQVTVDTRPVYSGSSFFSLNTDAADIIRFSSVMGQRPVFLDNSMLAHTEWGQYGGNHYYPGKLRLYNIFEPYCNDNIREFFSLLDTSMFVINLPVHSEISVIRAATAAEFMWNSSSYAHDFALWKVLMTRYGEENARDLISYSDKYSICLEAISRVEMKIQVARNIRISQQTIIELTTLLASVNERIGNQNRLVKELQEMNTGLRIRLQSIQPAERR